jgi:hypothetical protein
MAYDSAYLYVAVATNSWRRAAVSTWASDAFFSSISTLLHFDGANNATTFTDSSSTPKTFTAYGNAKLSTAQSKFGNASLYLDGSNSYISAPTSAAFGMGTGDFTFEGWFYPTSTTTLFANLFNFGTYASGVLLRIAGSGTGGDSVYFSNSQVLESLTNSNIPINAWTHVALVRSSGTVYLFINGTILYQQSSVTTNLGSTQTMTIGKSAHIAAGTNSDVWTGYIDEVRVTKGVARYTSTFTPQTAAFPDF